MPDAGSIWERGISDFGQNIGKSIGEFQQRRKQQDQLWGQLQTLRSMDDPANPGHSLLPDKVFKPLEEMHNRHQAINEGSINLLTQIYGKAALTGATAKAKAEQQAIQPWLDEKGNEVGYWKGGIPHAFPKNVREELSGESKPEEEATKKLNKTLSTYGLNVDDLKNVDPNSLHFQDEDGNPINPSSPEEKQTWGQFFRNERSTGKEDLGQDAKFVGGNAGDKTFQIEIKKWRQIEQASKNLKTGEGAREQTGKGKKLDSDIARKILSEAGGDPAKARQIARARGYVF